jgi:hypothetical protein
MHVRDFLPGEPVVGDIVVSTDGSWPNTMRMQRFEMPQAGKLYQVRRTENCLDEEAGEHELIRLAPYPSVTAFHLPVKGWWSSLLFKATHDPQREWPKKAGPSILIGDAAGLDPTDLLLRRLWHARQCGAWRQLCESNFGLALALAGLHPSHCDDPAAWQERLAPAASMRRLDICRQLGFPASTSTLRILERLHPSWGQALRMTWTKGMLITLRQLLTYHPAASCLLARHRAIIRAHVKLLAFGTDDIPLQLLFGDEPEILRGEWFFRLPSVQRHWLAAEFRAISSRESRTAGTFLLPSVRTLGTFQREKDAVTYLIKRQHLLDCLDSILRRSTTTSHQQWPEPPLPGSDLIQPITSRDELSQEGIDLKHCIADYADHITLGAYFAYRMLRPVRCTIGLRWNSKRWTLDQICGKGNSLIDDEQANLVREWIQSHAALAASLNSGVAKEISRVIGCPRTPRPFPRSCSNACRYPDDLAGMVNKRV